MLCHEVRELLPMYAAGAATDEERAGVDAHLSVGCEACQRELGEFHAAASLIIEDEPLCAPPLALKSALLETISSPPKHPTLDTKPVARWTTQRIATAAIGLAAAAAIAVFLSRPADDQRNPRTDTEVWRKRVADTERRLGAAGLSLVDLTATTEQSPWLSHLLYDELSGQLHVWTKSGDVAGRPNWVWLIGVDGSVIADCPLTGSSLCLNGLVDLPALPVVSPKLYLTIETTDAPQAPSEQVVQIFDVPVR